jgi:CRISPR-associated endonuclease/helicase Cas3
MEAGSKNMSVDRPLYIAHQRKIDGATQSLEEHLLGVAAIAKTHASKISLQAQGELIGLLHDLGKYSNEFQVYLKSVVGLINQDEDEFVDVRGLKGKVDHSTAGAQLVWGELSKQGVMGQVASQILALCIASHHSGLIDCLSSNAHKPVENIFTKRTGKQENRSHLREVTSKMDTLIEKRFRELSSMPSLISGIEESIRKVAQGEKVETIIRFKIGLLVRFLFSCLIDADRVDTADFERPKAAEHRLNRAYTEWALLIERLEKHLQGFTRRNSGIMQNLWF